MLRILLRLVFITVYHHPTNTDRLWVECIGFENATGGTGD